MNKLPLISVIIPVYKVEAYLDKCISSVVEQTYQNLEIILVDDGSPDNCPTMCDAWARKDNRIRVIHQKNAGGAAARNIALDAARGDLIAFVDSDDYIAAIMFEKLFALLEATGADIAECAYKLVYDDYEHLENEDDAKIRVFTTQEALRQNLYNTSCQQVIWNKIYKKNTIGTIRFVEGKTIDDEYFTYQVIGNSASIVVSTACMYFYRQQNSSVMHQTYSIKRLDTLGACVNRCEYIEVNYPQIASDARINLWLTCMYHYQMMLRFLHGNDKQTAKRTLKETMKKHRVFMHDVKMLNGWSKVWFYFSRLNFHLTCCMRNLLKIGQ